MSGSISQDEMDSIGDRKPVLPREPILTVVLGRMEPPHEGHEALIREALAEGDHTVLLLGSEGCSRSLDNPLTFVERKGLIEAIFAKEIGEGKLFIAGVRDLLYQDEKWLNLCIDTIKEYQVKLGGPEVVFVGMEKDSETAGCIAMFNHAARIHIVEPTITLDATDIRYELFSEFGDFDLATEHVHPAVKDFLADFIKTDEYARLKEEYAACLKQQKINAEVAALTGFPPIYVAVDALVVFYDYWDKPHLLLIRRKGPIGKGKYALPGGYLNADEYILTAVRRETGEETILDISKLRPKRIEVFDAPKRSKRGRMITHVHQFDLQGKFPPLVEGQDDAEWAGFVPLDKIPALMPMFFADHFHIIAKMMPEIEDFI